MRHELEEQVRGIGLERQVAELVDDQELGLGVEAEPVLEPPVGVRLDQGGDQRWRGDEQHRVALADRFAQGHLAPRRSSSSVSSWSRIAVSLSRVSMPTKVS